MQSSYRPEIDGLRAVAVGTVVMFHAFPRILHGGFVGVDVFFVISGFLITRIIVDEARRNEFRFSQFYGRRIRRIFPAFLLMVLAVAVVGYAVETTARLQLLGNDILGAVFFVPNFIFWHEAGYFDLSAATKPLLHTWSLGVEEQFYIVWPALILVVFRQNWNLTRTLVVLLV